MSYSRVTNKHFKAIWRGCPWHYRYCSLARWLAAVFALLGTYRLLFKHEGRQTLIKHLLWTTLNRIATWYKGQGILYIYIPQHATGRVFIYAQTFVSAKYVHNVQILAQLAMSCTSKILRQDVSTHHLLDSNRNTGHWHVGNKISFQKYTPLFLRNWIFETYSIVEISHQTCFLQLMSSGMYITIHFAYTYTLSHTHTVKHTHTDLCICMHCKRQTQQDIEWDTELKWPKCEQWIC